MKVNLRNRYSWPFSSATTNLERADESSYLITIIVSVLAFVILGTGIALWYFLVYRPRKNGMFFSIVSLFRLLFKT